MFGRLTLCYLVVILLVIAPIFASSNTQPHRINWFLTSKTGKQANVNCFTATTSGHLIVGGKFTENMTLYPNVIPNDVFSHGNNTSADKLNQTEPFVTFENTSPFSLTKDSLFVIKLNESDGTIIWQYSVDCETSTCKFYDLGVSYDSQTNPFVFLSVFLPLSTNIHPFTKPAGPLFFMLSLDDGTLKWNTQYLCYSYECYLPFDVLVKGDDIYISGRAKEDIYLSSGSFKAYKDPNANNEPVSNSIIQAYRRKWNSWEVEPVWGIQTHNTNSTAFHRIYHSSTSNYTMYLTGYFSGKTSWIDRKLKNFTLVDTNDVGRSSLYILKFDMNGNILDIWTNTAYRFEMRIFLYSKYIGTEMFVTACVDNAGLKSFSCLTLLDEKKLTLYSSYNSANSIDNFDKSCTRVQVYNIAGISKDLYIAMRCIYLDDLKKTQVEYKVNVRSITNFRAGVWVASYRMNTTSSSIALQRHEDTKSVNVVITSEGTFTESVSNLTFTQDNYAFTLFELPFMYPHTTCFGIASNESSVCSSHGVCIYEDECECNDGWGSYNCKFPFCGEFLSNETSKVCSGIGICTQPNTCQCPSGKYTGHECEFPICYGIQSDDERVCSGRGICSAPNNCTCGQGFAGLSCEFFICDGMVSNQSKVCSGHGNCKGPDSCECSKSYDGQWCQFPICYNISANSTNVCSGYGNCSSPNNCSCKEGYFGSYCELNACYGVFSNDPNVCNGTGKCVFPGTCECPTGKSGNQCQYHVCYGKSLANNITRVCSGHGNCVQSNSCQCENGWDGQECQFPICFGKSNVSLSTDNTSLICSANGHCISPNTCECKKGYEGIECQTPLCFNISALNNSVCSYSNGVCIAPNTCKCNEGRGGTQCENIICFNVESNSPKVCNGHGDCTSFNVCNCSSGYTGFECEIPYCYGKIANDSFVCSNRGTCRSKDSCECNSGYFGNECQWIDCFGVLSNNSNVCSGNGKCSSPGICECSSVYQGPKCQYPICFGIGANESTVCNFKGTCKSPDLCICENGKYAGLKCDQPICFDIPATDTLHVCNTNGTCIEPNVCHCNSLYGGPECSIPLCFGVLANNTNAVCSGNGTCLAPDSCQCKSGYFGDRCQSKFCYDISSEDSTVCNGNGRCIAKDTCLCNATHTGLKCDIPKCNGIPATLSSACSYQGSCSGYDTCKCHTGYHGKFCEAFSCFGIKAEDSSVCNHGNGTCTAKDNCKCNEKFKGLDCSLVVCFGIVSNDSQVCNGRGICTSYDRCQCNSGYNGTACKDKEEDSFKNDAAWIVSVSIVVPIALVFSLAMIVCCISYCYYSKRWKRNINQEQELQKKLMEMSLSVPEHLEGQASPFHLLRPSLGDYRELDDENSDLGTLSSFNVSSGVATGNSDHSNTVAGIKSITESKIYIPYKDLEFEKKLGSGGGGDVYLAKWKQNQVAVKKVEELESFLKEVTLLHNLKHPNIITIYGVSFLNGSYMIVMEYMPKGSLESYLYQLRIGNSTNIKLQDKISILLDISKGMDYLHTLKPVIVHRDLKPGNVLMDNSNKCKVADFGLSRALTKNTNMTNNIGTLFYMGVELFEENGKSVTNDTATALDVYSFAIISWELLFEESPYIYSEKNRKKLFKEIDYETSEYKKAENNSYNVPGMVSRGVRPIIPFSTLQSCKEWCEAYLPEKSKYAIVFSWTQLIKSCWEANPDARPSFSEITQKLMAFDELLKK